MLLFALVAFTVGLSCGWLLKPLRNGDVTNANSSSSNASPTETHGVLSAPSASRGETSTFISRLADALSIGNRIKRERAFAAIADDLDGAQVREALAQLEKTRIANRAEVRAKLLARWAELDPESARDYALALSSAVERRDAVNAVVSGWVERDAGAAAKWIAALPGGPMKNSASKTLIQTVAATDPKSALALLQATPSFPNTSGAFGERAGLIDAIFSHWAETDPRNAATATVQLNDFSRKYASFVVASRWANTDLAGALAWAQSQPNERAKRRLSEGYHEADPLTGVLQTWMNQDAAAAKKWLEELPDGNEKANLIQSAGTLAYHQDPVLRLDLALMIPEGIAQQRALQDVARSWARFDPPEAYAWATAQADDRVRQNTLKIVATEWLTSDPQGATQWLASLPASAEKDGMVGDAIGLILEGEQLGNSGRAASVDRMPGDGYRTVAQLIAGIRGTSEKQTASEKLARIWLSKNPAAARAWLATSTLPAEVKDRLLQPPKAGQPPP